MPDSASRAMPSAFARTPLGRFGRRLRDAAAGAALLYRTAGNARIECLLGYLAMSAALAEGGAWRVCMVALATAGVLAVEGVNTAVEHAIDRIGPERHPLSKAAKDAAAGAVLVIALGALAVAAVALVPHMALSWRAWQRAAVAARVGWLLGFALLVAGVARPERKAQGPH